MYVWLQVWKKAMDKKDLFFLNICTIWQSKTFHFYIKPSSEYMWRCMFWILLHFIFLWCFGMKRKEWETFQHSISVSAVLFQNCVYKILTYFIYIYIYSNLRSSLLRCGTRPNEWGIQWDSNSLLQVYYIYIYIYSTFLYSFFFFFFIFVIFSRLFYGAVILEEI